MAKVAVILSCNGAMHTGYGDVVAVLACDDKRKALEMFAVGKEGSEIWEQHGQPVLGVPYKAADGSTCGHNYSAFIRDVEAQEAPPRVPCDSCVDTERCFDGFNRWQCEAAVIARGIPK